MLRLCYHDHCFDGVASAATFLRFYRDRVDPALEEVSFRGMAHRPGKLFDADACRCSNYAERHKHVPDCIKLTPHNIEALEWMPKSCAYRRLHEGRGLASWHPLISGDPESVHKAGVSIRGQTISEDTLADPEDALDFEAPDLIDERG